MQRLNCWDVKDCGRAPGGRHVGDMGACPTALDRGSDGLNGGINGGRICWAVAGSMCGGTVQGTFAAKYRTCRSCDFFRRVFEEEGVDHFLLVPHQFEAAVFAGDVRTAGFKGHVLTLAHPAAGDAVAAHGLVTQAHEFIAAQAPAPVAILHDATLLQAANNEYRDAFVRLEHDHGAQIAVTAAVFPNVLMRVLARTIHAASGRDWRFFRDVPEAAKFLAQAGYRN